MDVNKEISALFTLIDDPDEEVFGVVSNKLIDYGKNIIPQLEDLWEITPEPGTQERIELLIHRLHFRDLKEDMRQWNISGHHDLLAGALLVSKFQYPDLSFASVLHEIEKVRRNIWLELNNYLTPLEQINVLTSILYNYYSLKGTEINYSEPNDFLFHKLVETKRGNQINCGIFYTMLCDMLDIPVKAIAIPRQFVLAYFKPGYSDVSAENILDKIEFFIDPSSGHVFTHKDAETYFSRIGVAMSTSYFRPLSNKAVVRNLLEQLSKCFDTDNTRYKQDELTELVALLD